jgi:hypothetical protein
LPQNPAGAADAKAFERTVVPGASTKFASGRLKEMRNITSQRTTAPDTSCENVLETKVILGETALVPDHTSAVHETGHIDMFTPAKVSVGDDPPDRPNFVAYAAEGKRLVQYVTVYVKFPAKELDTLPSVPLAILVVDPFGRLRTISYTAMFTLATVDKDTTPPAVGLNAAKGYGVE